MQNIDLIALDLDGTALAPGNTVTEATKAAVTRARAAGVHIVIATGRICGEAREFAREIGADDLMVTSGGAALSSIRLRPVCPLRLPPRKRWSRPKQRWKKPRSRHRKKVWKRDSGRVWSRSGSSGWKRLFISGMKKLRLLKHGKN